MQKNRRLIYAFTAFIVTAAVGIMIAVYSVVVNGMIETQTIDTISELALHDSTTIKNFVESNWKNLERAGDRLLRNSDSLTDVEKINAYLSDEASESAFDKIYLMLEDKTYYTDIAYRDPQTVEYYDYSKLFTGDENKAIGFVELPIMQYDRVLVYARKMDGYLSGIKIGEEQKEVFAIIAVNRRSSIRDGLVIASYYDGDGSKENGIPRGHSAIVTSDGSYIIDRIDTASTGVENWFSYIDERNSSDLTSKQVQELMSKNETFWFYHKDGVSRELNYCVPFDQKIGWYFLFVLDDSVIAENTNPFVMMIALSLAVIALIAMVAMIVVFKTQHKTEKALASERAQSEFLSNMSHEIRTPLNGLVGLNYLMITAIDNPKKKKQIKAWLSKSHSTSKYLLSLINDILDVSKLRAGKVTVVKEPLLVEPIVDAIYSMQCENIKNRHIEYLTDVHIDYPCILSDEVRIKQVLMNIVSNAAKFTPAGGFIKLSVSQQKTDSNHVMTTFVCEDSGCGMHEEFLSKIFDAFTQDRNSNSTSIKGTGLGMAISKLLVNAMGGEITVQSTLGKGSKFTVTIPAEISDIPDYLKFNVDDETERLAIKCVGVAKDKRLKVLVAEDNELNAEILLEILKEAGFEVAHAADGKQAVELFAASAPNEFGVVLMDMRMPVMDGCVASSKIRALDRADAKTVPIFACTANSFKEDRINAFDSGMNDFLTKPIDVKVLLQKMETVSFRAADEKQGGSQGSEEN